ncbi:hypothetical protein K493DRAFT_297230 [Basidiobolus meristosporus CBS 931.73]|uniref:Uncharacterized protein n=1 Tax=Basidiobolus meristosporus CBS 931.73 TaxID=1314790 RepID=A0A1Y1Z0P9_9FUNG|nr:hypothetical protein K493DRAFT_297230 [Basidiobolus meristosporus CBS 931.73]|eukprot:ORY03871.1 hypothetical protein K493DRAFT_297230 [Basidiobolus meristosporus CBS 931.73]
MSTRSEPVWPAPQPKHEIPPVEEATFTLYKSLTMLSEEVMISKTCLENHMVDTYIAAFQMAVKNVCDKILYKKETELQNQAAHLALRLPSYIALSLPALALSKSNWLLQATFHHI